MGAGIFPLRRCAQWATLRLWWGARLSSVWAGSRTCHTLPKVMHILSAGGQPSSSKRCAPRGEIRSPSMSRGAFERNEVLGFQTIKDLTRKGPSWDLASCTECGAVRSPNCPRASVGGRSLSPARDHLRASWPMPNEEFSSLRASPKEQKTDHRLLDQAPREIWGVHGHVWALRPKSARVYIDPAQ
jgi:hypothetical protein